MTFIEQCVAGMIEDPKNDIHEFIARWYEDPEGIDKMDLHDYLGMTWGEYATWAMNGDSGIALDQIIEDHRW